MFQSEQLQEKWSPLLDYEGLDPIKDNHRRAVTAVLLENQEKFLKEEQAFSSGINLMEAPPTNSANAAAAAFAELVGGASIKFIPDEKACSSFKNFSWFSSKTAVTALL